MEVKRTPLFARAVRMLEISLQHCYPFHRLVEGQGKGDHSTDPLNWRFGGAGNKKCTEGRVQECVEELRTGNPSGQRRGPPTCRLTDTRPHLRLCEL